MAKDKNVSFKTERVRLDRVFNDKSRNPRMPSNYKTDPIKDFDPEKNKAGLYEMIDAEGILVPPAVSRLSPERKAALKAARGIDADVITIWGHRRIDVATKIHAVDPKRFETVDMIVYEGLTEADEIKMLMDHEGVEGLNEFELFSAILSLKLNTSMSEEQIGIHVGKSRGFVQRRLWIAALPAMVQENYRKKFERDEEGNVPPHVPITDKNLVALNKAATADRTDTPDHPKVDPASPGSQFMTAWDKLVKNGEVEPPVKAKSRAEILEAVQYVQDPIIKHVMYWAAGDDVKLTDATDMISNLRAKLNPGT